MLISLFWTVPSLAAPTISAINDQTIDEDTNLTVTFSVGSDGSTDGTGDSSPFPFPFPTARSAPERTTRADNAISVTVTTSNHVLIPDNGIALNKNGSNYTLIISPAPERSGQATIYITADDGSYSTQESFILTVLEVNDAPVADAPDDQEMLEDGILVFDGEKQLKVSDVDAGDDIVRVTVGVMHGILIVTNQNASEITGNNTGDLILRGTIDQVNAALDELQYRPDPNWNGEDTLTLTITDNPGTGSGPTTPFPFPFPSGDTDSGSVDTGDSKSDADITKITVIAVPDPLSLELPSEAIEISEDTALSFDPDSDPSIKIVDADGPFGEFEVAFRVDGPAAFFIPEHAEVTADFEGPDDLLLRGTLPQINAALSGSTVEDGILPGLMIEPESDWHGELNLTITATDLTNFDTETGNVVISVIPVNDAPTLEEDARYTLTGIPMNASDPAGNKVADITRSLATDIDDPEDPAGIAVINADSTNGTWEYSIDDGAMWDPFVENLSTENALLLDPEYLIRFIPAADWIGVAGIDFRAWDRTEDTRNTTENGDATAFSTVIGTADITVSNEPAGPILAADAGQDLDVSEGDDVFLDGSGSQISDELTIQITWTQLSGPSVDLSDDETLQPSFRAPHVGPEGAELEFELNLTDNLGRSRDDRIRVRVFNSDQIRAVAGPDKNVQAGDVVTLSAAQSFIPDEISPLFRWEQSSGDTVELSNPNSEETAFIAPEPGSAGSLDLEFRLTISDNSGQSASDSVTITVTDPSANRPPSAQAGPNRTVSGGNTVSLDGSGSSDPDGSIVAYRWESITDGSLALTTPEAAAASFIAPAAEGEDKVLQFRLTVTDDQGLSDSDIVRITVAAGNDIPTGPGQGNEISITVQEGQTVVLEAGNFGAGSEYFWTQTFGNPQVTLSDFGSPSPTFVAPSVNAGGTTLGFELVVDAADGNRHIQEYRVVIQNNGIVGFPANVLSFRLFNGSTMGIQVSGSGTLVKLESIDPADIPDDRNRPAALPYGLIDMVIKVDEPGDTVNVTVYPESPASPQNTWFKYSEAEGWEDYSEHSHMKPDGTEITVFLADGGPGDADGIANGLIVDPSGPALPSSSTAGGGGDGADGGCFIQTMVPDIF